MATVDLTPIEVIALKKLAVICGALAHALSGTSAIEQRALNRVLIDVVNRAELSQAVTA